MKQDSPSLVYITQSIRTDIINILVLIALWVTITILVNPIGDFPLNDDWAYGYSVKVLLEKGDFQLSGWAAPNLFSQVLWGALFCLPFGFSFTALRFSTLTLGLIGVIATYGLLRELNSSQKISLLGALVIAINPIYFGLSNTFMNDIPFFGFATLSLYFLFRGLKHDSIIEVAIGILFTCVAILTRQLGLAIPLAFGCGYLIKKGANIQTFIKGFSPTLVGVGIQLSYQKWLQLTMRLPDNSGIQIKTLYEELYRGVSHTLSNCTTITLFSLVYLGLFVFPFLIILPPLKFKELSSRQRTLTLLSSSTFFVVIMTVLVLKKLQMPLLGNIFVDFGLGPVVLKNSGIPNAPKILWIILTGIGIVGAALLLQFLFHASVQIFDRHTRPELINRRWMTIFIFSALCIYFFPLGFMGFSPFGFYDRYLIFLLPLLMMAVSVSTSNISNKNVGYMSTSFALIMMILYGVFTIGATHDYLSWNRARWQALHNLMQENHISPDHIDGGMEFNGWYLYNEKYEYDPTYVKSWYWVDNDDYVICFKPLTGYEEVKRYTFRRWLPLGEGNILVLKKTTDVSH